MGFQDVGQGVASIIFLVLFLALGSVVIWGLVNRRPKRRFIGLTIFSAIRIGSQIAGIGFAVASYSNFNWLIAYFVLGAEGYFALSITSLYILIGWQYTFWGTSWLHRPINRKEVRSPLKRLLLGFRDPATWFHYALIPANVLTIYGGTSQSSSDGADYTNNPAVTRGRILRSIGQALFFVLTMVQIIFVLITIRQAKRGSVTAAEGRPTPTLRPLYLLLATFPFFVVRGVFGIVSSASSRWSYYNPYNYDQDGLVSSILALEYCAGLTMEFFIAILLVCAAFDFSRKKGDPDPNAVTSSGDTKRDVEEGGEPVDRK